MPASAAFRSRPAPRSRSTSRQLTSHITSVTGIKPVTNKGWWKPKRLPVEQPGPLVVPDSYPTGEARRAQFGRGQEQIEPLELPAQGKLPEWLQGRLVLNGPGDYTGCNHMFDGFASLAEFDLQKGRVTGRHRMLETKAYRALKETGVPKFREFSVTVPTPTQQDQIKAAFGMVAAMVTDRSAVFTDNCSINVLPLADGTFYASSETAMAQYIVDPATLTLKRQVHLSGDGVSGDIQTAHALQLPDGRLINFAYDTPFGSYTVYSQDPQTLRRTKLATIPHRGPFQSGWMHAFGCTTKHAVLIEPPLFMDLGALMVNEQLEYIMANWKADEPTRVIVVPLDGSGKTQTYTLPPLFYFHYGNAFESEDGRYLYVDLSVFDDPTIIKDLLLDNCRADYPAASLSEGGYRRLTIPLADGQTSTGLYGDSRPELLIPPRPLVDDEHATGNYSEFPAFNPAYFGKPYRYAYIMSAVRPTNLGNALSKLDLQERTVAKTWHRPGWLSGEPKFVAAPNAQSEDDGVVMVLAVSAAGKHTLVVLDAASFEELALVEAPFTIGQRFHGSFIPAAARS